MTAATVSGFTYDVDALAEVCRRSHITRLRLYGSVLRDDFDQNSDVDVLVEFDREHVPGREFVDIELELSSVLGRRVDLTTPAGLSKYIRDRVLAEAQTVYVVDDETRIRHMLEAAAKARIAMQVQTRETWRQTRTWHSAESSRYQVDASSAVR
jgi:predicted nucleotidyltransferase